MVAHTLRSLTKDVTKRPKYERSESDAGLTVRVCVWHCPVSHVQADAFIVAHWDSPCSVLTWVERISPRLVCPPMEELELQLEEMQMRA